MRSIAKSAAARSEPVAKFEAPRPSGGAERPAQKSRLAAVPQEKAQGRGGFLLGRAFSGRAELRHHNSVLKVVILFLMVILLWHDYSWRKHLDLVVSQHQGVVFRIAPDGTTTAEPFSNFQFGPTEEEVRGRAWECVRWIVSAGSNNVDVAYSEAKRMMTAEMAATFDAASMEEKEQLKARGIYKKVDQVQVRPLTLRDLPPGSKGDLTKYDVLVSGQIEIYQTGSNQNLGSVPFTYHVRLLPLEKRTTANPAGLLVSGMQMLDPRKSVAAREEAEKRGGQAGSGEAPAPQAQAAPAGADSGTARQ